MIEFIPVVMVHDHLSKFDSEIFSLTNYSFRNYQPGDELQWSELQSSTDSFKSKNEALQYFNLEFGSNNPELFDRCFFLVTNDHDLIGSAMSWFADGQFHQEYGRLHWVVVDPDFRGKGLGKYLIKYTLYRMSERYTKAYLTTQTTSYPAINIYLDLGFKPWTQTAEDYRAWKLLSDVLGYPLL